MTDTALDAAPAGADRAARCRSRTCTSPSAGATRRCRRWPASASPCARARRSAWSASRAAASPPPAGPSSRSSGPTSGTIRFGDTELTALSRGDLRTLRTQVQMIFQDPISSLNPRRRVADIVAEPLDIWKIGHQGGAARQAPTRCSTRSASTPYVPGDRRPREFSGRPVPAHQHRPRPGAQAQAARVRRDRLRPRRLGAGPDPQPARGPEAASTASPSSSSPTTWPW